MRVGSLFAGIGGFDLAARWMGWRTVWYSEIDPYASAVMAKHFPEAVNLGDIRTITDPPAVDVLCGGFPCQDLSYAGKGAGISGARSGLWTEYARLIRTLRPRYVVVENVPALLRRGMDVVAGDLAACGYDAEWDCIPASAVGANHRRDRVWVIAYPSRNTLRVQPERDQRGPAERGHTVAWDNGFARQLANCENFRLDGRLGLTGDSTDAGRGWDAGRNRSGPDRRIAGAVADATRDGRVQGIAESAGIEGGSDAVVGGRSVPDADRINDDDAGHGAGAILGDGPRAPGLLGSDATVPDAAVARLEGRVGEVVREHSGQLLPGPGGASLPDADGGRREVAGLHLRPGGSRQAEGVADGGRTGAGCSDWWLTEPDVGRVANGVPSRVDRLRCLGNAVVPQVVAVAFQVVIDRERRLAEAGV